MKIVPQSLSAPSRATTPSLVAALLVAAGLWVGIVTPAVADDADQAERVAVGDEAPDFSLDGSDGQTYALSEIRGEEPLALIFFRGSW